MISKGCLEGAEPDMLWCFSKTHQSDESPHTLGSKLGMMGLKKSEVPLLLQDRSGDSYPLENERNKGTCSFLITCSLNFHLHINPIFWEKYSVVTAAIWKKSNGCTKFTMKRNNLLTKLSCLNSWTLGSHLCFPSLKTFRIFPLFLVCFVFFLKSLFLKSLSARLIFIWLPITRHV